MEIKKFVECKTLEEWKYVKTYYNKLIVLNIFPIYTCISLENPDNTFTKNMCLSNSYNILSFNQWKHDYVENLDKEFTNGSYVTSLSEPIKSYKDHIDTGGPGFIPNVIFKISSFCTHNGFRRYYMENHRDCIYSNAIRKSTNEEIKLYDNFNKPTSIFTNNYLNNNKKDLGFKEGDLVVFDVLKENSSFWIEEGEIVKLGGKYWKQITLNKLNNCEQIAAISIKSPNGNGAYLDSGCISSLQYKFRHATSEEIEYYNKIGIGANIKDMKKPVKNKFTLFDIETIHTQIYQDYNIKNDIINNKNNKKNKFIDININIEKDIMSISI